MSLKRIALRDFVIVRELELELGDGFSVLTGETGAGKSVLVEGIGLLPGGRASAGTVRTGASAATQPNTGALFRVQSTPIATRSSMSTTSSPGRRPFGNPATSPPSTPSRCCDARSSGVIEVLSRSISDGVPLAGLFKPGTPVRNAVNRSGRGKFHAPA